MANKITQIVEWKDSGGLKKIKQDIRETDGLLGKMKTGISGSISAFRQSNTAQAAAIGGVAAGALKAIDYASDLNESINAINVTYGQNADAVLAIGENAAKSFGLAKSEFNGFAVQYSSFVKQVAAGSGQSEATVLDDLVTRVSDFASVMNLQVPEAAAIFQSALSGETEPIRRFGKDLSAAAVEQYALRTGLIETKAELTEAIKVQARYGLLMEQTNDTAGDFTNTSGELANSQRILAAEAKDLAADIGSDLAPALLTVVQGLQSIIETAEKVHLDDALNLGWVEKSGNTLGKLLSPWNTGARQANEAFVESLQESEREAANFDRALLENAKTANEVRDIVNRYGLSVEAGNVVVVEWARAQEQATTALEGTEGAVDGLGEAVGRSTTPIDLFHDTVDLSASALEAQADAADEAAEALEARYGQALDNVVSKTQKLLNGLNDIDGFLAAQSDALDYADALQSIEDAEVALAEAIQDHGKESIEAEKAQRNLSRTTLSYYDRVLDLIRSLGDVPSSKLTEITLAMKAGDVDKVEALIDDITRDRMIQATVVPVKQQAFDQALIDIANGVAPSGPTFTNPNPAPAGATSTTSPQYVDNSRTTIVYPVGTTPRTQRVDRNIDDRRNGLR